MSNKTSLNSTVPISKSTSTVSDNAEDIALRSEAKATGQSVKGDIHETTHHLKTRIHSMASTIKKDAKEFSQKELHHSKSSIATQTISDPTSVPISKPNNTVNNNTEGHALKSDTKATDQNVKGDVHETTHHLKTRIHSMASNIKKDAKEFSQKETNRSKPKVANWSKKIQNYADELDKAVEVKSKNTFQALEERSSGVFGHHHRIHAEQKKSAQNSGVVPAPVVNSENTYIVNEKVSHQKW